ncbi:hypothetical protein [Pseudonocardia sp. HH130630-07]|uniref:hypothetical protein n=1 Tax=Pseudonocardia sp. HH130630-07 TaxID=1690815 RepID=UPI000815387C|nr:hypothetical protein [Pseudonocardia sp. HH130630-07]ANY07149.1 hypothetical protein AFB00_13630 [Pseudonocardia sp. HH130630-07]
MVLTILAVTPVLAILLVMAAQPLFEMWDARSSERAVPDPGHAPALVPDVPVSAQPTLFPESLGDVAVVLRIPEQRAARTVPVAH